MDLAQDKHRRRGACTRCPHPYTIGTRSRTGAQKALKASHPAVLLPQAQIQPNLRQIQPGKKCLWLGLQWPGPSVQWQPRTRVLPVETNSLLEVREIGLVVETHQEDIAMVGLNDTQNVGTDIDPKRDLPLHSASLDQSHFHHYRRSWSRRSETHSS